MVSTFRVPIVRRKSEEKKSTALKETTYSRHEVEDIICKAIEFFNFTDLIKRNGIDIECIHDEKGQIVTVIIRQGNEASKFSVKVGE